MPLGYIRGRGFGWLRPQVNCCETCVFREFLLGLLQRAQTSNPGQPWPAVANRGQLRLASRGFGWPAGATASFGWPTCGHMWLHGWPPWVDGFLPRQAVASFGWPRLAGVGCRTVPPKGHGFGR